MRVIRPLIVILVGFPWPAGAQQPLPPPAPASPPASAPAPATAKGMMEPPKLPPFAGALVNFDRREARVVACVDRAAAPKPGQPVSSPAAAPAPAAARSTRIWVLENEVMQELLTTGGLCDPAWSPDGKAFAAAGVRGVFTFTQPLYEVKVIVAGQTQPPAAGETAAKTYASPTWSPSGRRLAFLVTTAGGGSVQVVDVASGERVFERATPAKIVAWGADDKTLLVDRTKIAVP